MSRKLRKRTRDSRHHVIPRSRGGKFNDENIVIIPRVDHELYHKLFGNMKPEEIIEHLQSKYWGEVCEKFNF
jgi:hypothetical protein